MSVIDSYLDTLFRPYPDSPRLRSARAELAAMMEDKLADLQAEGLTETQALGRVIAEFGSLDEVAPVLGIDQEVGEVNGRADRTAPGDDRPRLDLEGVQRCAETSERAQPLHALGVATFVLCPVPLLLLIAASVSRGGAAQNWATAIGITCVLVLVALGILLSSRRAARLSALEHGSGMTEGEVALSPSATRWIEDRARQEAQRTALLRGIAIALFVLAAVPTVVLSTVASGSAVAPLLGVCGTLMMVAAGVYLSVRTRGAEHARDMLLASEEDDEEEALTRAYPVLGVVMAVYWPLTVAIFLAWSFIGGDWGTSWVIWPIAGILYGALWSGGGALMSARRRNEASSAR